MLTPEQVNAYAGLMAAPWEELNDRILRDMVRRIIKAGKITSTAEWQMFRAQALGASRDYLLRQMAAIAYGLSGSISASACPAGREKRRSSAGFAASSPPGACGATPAWALITRP